jgi:hypothetical protein
MYQLKFKNVCAQRQAGGTNGHGIGRLMNEVTATFATQRLNGLYLLAGLSWCARRCARSYPGFSRVARFA